MTFARFWQSARRLRTALLCGLFLVGAFHCGNGNKPATLKAPQAQPVAEARWNTMHAVHHVHIDAAKGDGRQVFDVRGMIAVERPDRFRLQAFGPGGILLFDILKLGGDIRVLVGIRGADPDMQQRLLLAIGADLTAAYDLEPALPSRQKIIGQREGELRIIEPERNIRAQQFKEISGQSVPTHLEIVNEASNYKVSIDVESITLDDKLDPALFHLPN